MTDPEHEPVIEVEDNAIGSRYIITVDGEKAGFAEYRRRDGRTIFTHTEIDEGFSGLGLGSKLARAALDDVSERFGGGVVPLCPFIKGWIEKHPDYQHLVASEHADTHE